MAVTASHVQLLTQQLRALDGDMSATVPVDECWVGHCLLCAHTIHHTLQQQEQVTKGK
jgi:hypothetical protein